MRVCALLFLAGSAYAQPAIYYRGVLNAASYVTPGLPGGGIARGSTFTMFGRRIGPDSSPSLSFPLQTTLGGVSISVTQGATTVNAIPVFVSASQINAIMPSNAPLGMVSVRVTYNNSRSNPAPVRVVESQFGIFTVNSAGSGPAIAQNFIASDQQPIDALQNAAKPGQAITLWGTGLGAVSFPDNVAPTPGNVNTKTELFVGGQPATLLYSGRSPCCAGIDQIVFQVPANAPLGCWVPVAVRTGGTAVSNTGTIAISANGGPCAEPSNALPSGLIAGGNVVSFVATRISVHEDIGVLKPGEVTSDLVGGFLGTEKAGPYNFNPMFSLPPPGVCTAYTVAGWFPQDVSLLPGMAPTALKTLDAGTPSFLGAKGNVTLATPGILGGLAFGSLGSALSAVPALANKATLDPGSYSISASGGKDVGAFSVSGTIPTPLTWTNRDQLITIDRSRPLMFNWSGANGGSTVFAVGGATDLPTNSTSFFLCVASPGATSISVPAYMLSNIPASRTNPLQSPAVLYLGQWSFGNPATFKATGVDFGLLTTAVVSGRTVIFQ